MEQAVAVFRAIGSPAFPHDEDEVRERAGPAYDRCYALPGLMRQAITVIASGGRSQGLRSIRAPTWVIQGSDGRMTDVGGGRAITQAIPGAERVLIEGLSHNLPRGAWPRIVSLIADQILRVEAGAGETV